MIDKKVEDIFLDDEYGIMTPLKNISTVFDDNNLSHAMLVLKESNYQQIPVLDYDKKFKGLISLHQIYKSLGENLFGDFEKLYEYKVKDHIDTHFATIHYDYKIEDILKILIDYNFINVIDYDNHFIGMITRSAILKKTNYLVHNIQHILSEENK